MFETGYIKLHRSILSWEWYDDIPTQRLFLHLLLTVNIKDSKFQGYDVPKGSRICSLSKLSEETGLTEKQIRGSLDKLIRAQTVARLKTPKFSIISINNWGKFQSQGTDKGTGRAQSRAPEGQHNKNIKNKEESFNTPKRVLKDLKKETEVSQYADRNDAWD